MSKIGDTLNEALKNAGRKAADVVKDASAFAEDAQKKAKEKSAIRAVDKKRDGARKIAVTELKDAIADLNGLMSISTSVPDSVNLLTQDMIKDAEKLKSLVYTMTPITLVPVLEEYRDKWKDDAIFETDAENLAQRELDKKEYLRRCETFINRCEKAIEVLKKQAENDMLT